MTQGSSEKKNQICSTASNTFTVINKFQFDLQTLVDGRECKFDITTLYSLPATSWIQGKLDDKFVSCHFLSESSEYLTVHSI